MRHIFVFDTKFFRDQQWKMDSIVDSIGQYFRMQERSEFSTHTPRYPREAIGIIQQQIDNARAGDTIRVYAIGGEDNFFDCLNAIAGLPNAELAIVTSGNTNDFMRIFGLVKADITKDVQSLTTSPAIPTDLIGVDNWYALNGCFIGYKAAAGMKEKELSQGKKSEGVFGILRRILAFFNQTIMVFNKAITGQHYAVTIDGEDYSGNYTQISIFNGPYYDGNKIAAATALPNDGLLDLMLLKSAGALSILMSMRKFSRGKPVANAAVLQGKKIVIQTEEPVWVQMDGEFVQDTFITFEAMPKAVRIVTANKLTYEQLSIH